MLECVVNVSEGGDRSRISAIAAAAGRDLLDLHCDAFHNRSVLTLIGEAAPRAVTRVAMDLIDLRAHVGAHPRIGAVDVVPFVPLGPSTMADAVAARDRFGVWAATELGVPIFRYGPSSNDHDRTLPEIRRRGFVDLGPDFGPSDPHPSAGAIAVGARAVLVAYNVWLCDRDVDRARSIARALRRPGLRALGLVVGDGVQVSMNLVDPSRLGPAEATDLVGEQAEIEACELVGLVPRAVFDATPRTRWSELDLAEDRTIEARITARDER